MMMALGDDRQRYAALVGFGILGLVLIRLICAGTAPLAFDEAYYWLWSKHLATGYYDHPPMVAIVIRLGTLVAGDTELGIRFVAVLLALPASWAVWRSARILFGDDRIAVTAALFFNLTLIVAAGTVIVTPDAPLLVASAFVLFFLAKVSETGQGVWWLAVGAAVGVALLSKYTALFFGVSILAWLLIVPEMRRWLATPWPWLGGVLAFAMFVPVLMWNADHGWASFYRQFGRVQIEGFTLRYLAAHLAAQMGLATPSVFALATMGLFAFLGRRGGSHSARILIGTMAWPLALYFTFHSLHARVEGNWTSLIFPSVAIAAAVAAHGIAWRGVWAKVAFWSVRTAAPVGLAMAAIVYVQAMFGVMPFGASDPTARQLGAGWPDLAAQIDALRRSAGARVILTDVYSTTSWLAFYAPSRPPVVQFSDRIRWVNAPTPDPDLFRGPIIVVVGDDAVPPFLARRFSQVSTIGRMSRTRHGVVIETYNVFRLDSPIGEPLDYESISKGG